MIKGVEKKQNINGSLPIGWKIAQVKDICDIIRGVSYKKPDSIQEAQKGYLPILRATNIQDNSLVLDKDLVYVTTDLVSENQKLKIGDIVIATSSGSKHLVGKTAQVKRNWLGAFGAFCAAIRSTVEVDHRYLGYFFNSPAYKDVIAAKAIGVNINNLRRGDIEELKIPIAPLKEQKRIVAEIEKQFSRLDEAVENLKRVKANLKRYKASVLKAAVEGKLTEEWRKEHSDVEPADKLLAGILAERRKKWEEAELAKMKAKGNKPKDDKWKKKYNEPQKPSEFYLDLPTSWIEVRAEQICDFITKGTTPKAIKLFSDKGEIPFIKVYNLTKTGRLDFSIKPTFISNDTNEKELARSRVYPGDVLMNIVGPPLGKVSVIPNSFGEGNINQAIAIFRAMPSYNNLLLSYFLLSDTVLTWAVRRAKATAGQFNLTLEICRNLPIPVPPAEEQETIFKLLEQLFTIIDELNNIIDKNLKRAERLRQSILKKAFSGKLIQSKES